MTIKIDLESHSNVPLMAWSMNNNNAAPHIRKAYREHLFRRQGLALCKQLIQLAIELQKHRGCTLAILSGDHFFETQLYGIQRDITDQLNTVEEHRREFLSLDESMHIIQEWICIRRQWSNDSPEQNFLLHSNLIAELLKLIRQVVKRAQLLSTNPEGSALASFCFAAWLNMIETAAQARGLATHCAVQGHSPAELRSRLQFLHRQLLDLDQQFSDTLESIAPAQARNIRNKAERMEYQAHLKRFLAMLELDFCKKPRPETDADAAYTAGSHVVSACQQILVSILKIIETKPAPDLEDWINGKVGGRLDEKQGTSSLASPEHTPANEQTSDSKLENDSCFAAK